MSGAVRTFLTEEEIEFFKAAYKQIGGSTLIGDDKISLVHNYRVSFPKSKRTDAAIVTQWYCAKDKMYRYRDRSKVAPTKDQSVKQPTPADGLEYSRVKAGSFDNAMIDLIDCVSAIKAENEVLKDRIAELTEQNGRLSDRAQELDKLRESLTMLVSRGCA